MYHDQKDRQNPLPEEQPDKQVVRETLMGLIEETVAVHLRLQIITEELHGHSELSRACRGVLRDLARLGPRTVPQLARGKPVTRQYVQILVNHLIAEKLAEFIRNPEHKRSQLVRLTERGQTMLEEMWNSEATHLENLKLDLSLDELRAATTVLHRFRQTLEQYQINQEVRKN